MPTKAEGLAQLLSGILSCKQPHCSLPVVISAQPGSFRSGCEMYCEKEGRGTPFNGKDEAYPADSPVQLVISSMMPACLPPLQTRSLATKASLAPGFSEGNGLWAKFDGFQFPQAHACSPAVQFQSFLFIHLFPCVQRPSSIN